MRHDSRPPGRPQRADATGLASTRRPAHERLDQWGNALLAGDDREVDRIVRETRAAIVRTHLTHDGMFLR